MSAEDFDFDEPKPKPKEERWEQLKLIDVAANTFAPERYSRNAKKSNTTRNDEDRENRRIQLCINWLGEELYAAVTQEEANQLADAVDHARGYMPILPLAQELTDYLSRKYGIDANRGSFISWEKADAAVKRFIAALHTTAGDK